MNLPSTLTGLVAVLTSSAVTAGDRAPEPVAAIACGPGAPRVTAATRMLAEIPYKSIAVDRPARTIVLVHGGPDASALGAPDALDCYLARHFSARVVKPAYFGSSERSPWAEQPRLDLTTPLTRTQLAARLLRAIDVAYAGMPRSVREIRAFVDHWDGARTTVVGESHGAVLAALAVRARHRSALVLVAPVIASRRAIVRAAMRGRYVLHDPIDPPHLVLDGNDVTDRVFATRAERERLLEAVSLAYYRPWQDSTLSDILRRTTVRARIVVGLRDRVGMIGSSDWTRLWRAVPRGTQLCADPRLGHAPPMAGPIARRCFDRFMRLAPQPGSHGVPARLATDQARCKTSARAATWRRLRGEGHSRRRTPTRESHPTC